MQMNEQVLTALEVLRNFAENDFELHRIDVLEKDLTAPPKVEVIDDTHQKFNGNIYAPNKYGRYISAPKYLNREIFAYYYGEIPEGYEIHHKNENKTDNDISNLQMLTKSEHMFLHSQNKAVLTEFTCKECGKIFYANKTVKNYFCSPKCRSAWRRHNRIDDIEKPCSYCGKIFTSNKYDNSDYCSSACANRAKSNHKVLHKKTFFKCQVCGKIYKSQNNGHNKFCSNHCKNKNRRLKKAPTLKPQP